MLAVETNQAKRTMTINKVWTREGQTFMIPYVQAFENSNFGATQSITIQLDQAMVKL